MDFVQIYGAILIPINLTLKFNRNDFNQNIIITLSNFFLLLCMRIYLIGVSSFPMGT